MDNTQESESVSPPSIPAIIHLLINSAHSWLENLLHLAVLEGKKAGLGLASMIGFGIGAVILLIVAWLAILGCAVAALVENHILGLSWSLLIVAVLNLAGAVGLAFLVIKRSQDLLFCATRRQLGLKAASGVHHE